jgi:patatin-like phospholipase/acyl hydrolase
MQPTCRILAMDGGGIRGILPARVLTEIERRTSRSIADTFNLLAGTSTGGLLALGLAIPKPGKSKPYSAEQMLELYRVKGPTIFASSLWHSVASLGAITDTRYDSDNIEDVLEDLLKDRLLSDCLNEIDVLVPAYEIEQREAYFFKSWHAKGEPEDHRKKPAQRNFLARDVARATSAAPTYFEPARVKNSAGETFSFIDGGVFANNPAMSAVVAARWLYPQAQRFCILSLGTGTMERPIPYNQAKDWGLVGWARPVISVMMGGNSETVDYQLREIAEAFEVDVRYHRFDIDLGEDRNEPGAANDDFDDASPSNIRALFDKADELLALHKEVLDELIDIFTGEPKTDRVTLRGMAIA